MISHWRHLFVRNTTHQSLRLTKTFRDRLSTNQQSAHTIHEMEVPGPFMGTQKTIETVISAGSTMAGEGSEKNSLREEEPVSLIQHMARMGRRGSSHDALQGNTVTIKKEVYIREERAPKGYNGVIM